MTLRLGLERALGDGLGRGRRRHRSRGHEGDNEGGEQTMHRESRSLPSRRLAMLMISVVVWKV